MERRPSTPALPGLAARGVRGLRIGTFVAAGLVLLLAAAWWVRPTPRHERGLSAADLDTYLACAVEVRLGRHEAKLAGWPARKWHEWPSLAAALGRAGWTMEDYLRVEGQVRAAVIRIREPDLFASEFPPGSAPDAHLEIVRPRLDRVLAVQAPIDGLAREAPQSG